MPSRSPKGSQKPATLADVGRAAGVSAMAASAVLNGTKTSARIAAETRERIEAAAARLHYRPNVAARALLSRRMNTLGVSVVVHDREFNHYFLELFNGIIGGAAHHEQTTTVFPLENWDDAMPRLPTFCDGRIDGMILVGPVIAPENLRALPAHTPFVSLHANQALDHTINLETDELRGAREMVEHFVALGHRDILHVSGPRGLVGVERRIEGWAEALRGAGLPVDPGRVLSANRFTSEGGFEVLSAWLQANAGQPLPTALFCANDAIAVGCMEALAALGLRVPDDLSLGGFDDTLAARTTVPQLTTVRQPLRAMGVRAVEILLGRIEAAAARYGGKEPDGLPLNEGAFDPVVFETELVVRASSAPPRAAPRLIPPTPPLTLR